MIENIENIIAEQSCHEQGSLDWFRDRLGCVTASECHYLMKASDAQKAYDKALAKYSKPVKPKKGEEEVDITVVLEAFRREALENPFSDTCIGYFYEKAAERNLRPEIVNDDNLFEQHQYRVDITNKAMRHGHEWEGTARQVYASKYNVEVVECGFVRHKEILNFGDSPDGIVVDANGHPIGALEIKCPKPETWMRYKHKIKDAATLKEEKPEYYWQCQCHCICNNVPWCDFVFFDYEQRNGFVCIRIYKNEEDCAELERRAALANIYIDEMIK